MKILFIVFVFLTATLLFLQSRLYERNGELPVYLRHDQIAADHSTNIDFTIKSIFKPDSIQIQTLKKDYSNLWAHLNHLHETNEIEAGKEYYTEDWFRQINHHYAGTIESGIKRSDLQHNLQVENWSTDGLACTISDKDVLLIYQFPDHTSRRSKVDLEMVLLYQGDHWRIDAIRVMDETFLD